jgi:hypothetical protein
MILLTDLEGAMQLDRSKDMSVHVSTCIGYDFNALMRQLFGSCEARKTCVFLRLIAEMSDLFFRTKSQR